MHKTLFLALVIILCRQVYAQQHTIEQLRQAGEQLLDEEKYEEALQKNLNNLRIAREQKDVSYEALFLHNIALSCQHLNKDEQALTYYEQAFALAEQNNFRRLLNNIYYNRAILYRRKGQYTKAMRDLIAARTTLEEQHDINGLYAVYNSMGNIEYLRANYLTALQHFETAIVLIDGLLKETTDRMQQEELTLDMAISLNNMGEIYTRMSNFSLSLLYLDSALKYKQRVNRERYTAGTLLALGITYDSLDNTAQSVAFLNRAYEISKKHQSVLTLIQASNALASLYGKQKNYDAAFRYLDEGLELARTDSLREELLQNYDIRRKLYRKTGQLADALIYDDLYFETEQYLRNIAREKEIEELKTRYDLDKTNLQLEQSRQKNNWLIIVVVITISLLVSIAFAYVQKKKSRDKIEILMRELNHRVKNNLQVLLSMVSLQELQVKDSSSKALLKATQSRIMAMSFIHRKLYKDREFTLINIGDFIQELVQELQMVYHTQAQHVHVDFNLQLLELEVDKAIPLGLLVNELITNAFKYAFVQHPDARLHISLETDDRDITIIINDNGPGYHPEKSTINGFGSTLILTLIKQLKGKINYASGQGTTVTVHFRK